MIHNLINYKSLIIPILVCNFGVYAQTTIDNNVKLVSGSKHNALLKYDDFTIYSSPKSDTASFEVSIESTNVMNITNDTLAIYQPANSIYTKFIKSELYQINIDYPNNRSNTIKLNISDIDKIKIRRQKVKIPTNIIALLAGLSATIIAPAVSIGKEFDSKRYNAVLGYSIVALTTSLTINAIWGSKTFHLKSHKNKKIWKLD